MKFSLAFIAGLFACSVAGAAIPSTNADAVAEVLEAREPEPQTINADGNDVELVTLEATRLADDGNDITSFLNNISVGGAGYSSQRAFKRAAIKALHHLRGAHQLIHLLGRFIDDRAEFQSGNRTTSSIEDLEPDFVKLTETNYDDQIAIDQALDAILYGSGGYCKVYVPGVNNILEAANSFVQEKRPNDDDLAGLTVSSPTACALDPDVGL